ncbi:MAG: hypothetical protein QF898_09365 [SAR202 cluster bacterium]|jgi:hypothetical protein|nr:hypothetical protein [SAR202 cluster bacterium]MDP6512325.1 hypothetical protein [SAR202 cluster bacterium]MDP6715003.1 hypothetical protein [SAR202 cluster bacterium]
MQEIDNIDNSEDPSLDLSIEAQLTQYAKDLQELYRGKTSAEQTAASSKQQANLRSHEINALNKFLQGRLGEMFQLEAEYESLLDSLAGVVDNVQPPILRRTVQTWIDHGRGVLDELRNARM